MWMDLTIKTAAWSSRLPPGHARIGISRGQPRQAGEPYRMYRKLAPGPWFNSVSEAEYVRRFHLEVLMPLKPHQVAADLAALAEGSIPTLLCFERPGAGSWCHRSLVAAWLADGLRIAVPELGFEHLPQDQHPLLPPALREPVAAPQMSAQGDLL
jgi:Active DUF488-N3 subclade